MSPEKIRLQVPDRWAGAGRKGRAGMAGLVGMGTGAGPGRGAGGRARSCIKTRVETASELFAEGKIWYFSLDFPLRVPDFFKRKNLVLSLAHFLVLTSSTVCHDHVPCFRFGNLKSGPV